MEVLDLSVIECFYAISGYVATPRFTAITAWLFLLAWRKEFAMANMNFLIQSGAGYLTKVCEILKWIHWGGVLNTCIFAQNYHDIKFSKWNHFSSDHVFLQLINIVYDLWRYGCHWNHENKHCHSRSVPYPYTQRHGMLLRSKILKILLKFWPISNCVLLILAKEIIKGLLKTDPDERFTIEQLMNRAWISVSHL